MTGGIQEWVPGLSVARTYRRRWLRHDLVAGVVLAAILVPQGMAYAELAGLPAVNGLYATIACLVGYAVFGPSRILVVGPDSSLGPLILAAITPLVVVDDPSSAVALAAFCALAVAAVQIGLGVGRLGFVADLLSTEVQVGYMNGLAITIVVGQLPKLFGFSTDADGFIEEVSQFVTGFDERNTTTTLLGLACLVTLVVLGRLVPRIPAVAVVVVGSTLAVALFDLDSRGVDVVGALPRGLPSPALPTVALADVGPLLLAAVGITLVSLADTMATATSFASRRGEESDPNREMVGIGAANLLAGLFQGFPVSTSGSRTAVAEQSGARTQLTGVVGAAVVAVLVVVGGALVADLPQTALAAIVIVAAVSLTDLPALVRFRRMRPSSFVLSLVATLGVVILGVLPGIGLAVALSILMFFRRNWWPRGEVLGREPASGEWHSLRGSPVANSVPGVVVYRWEAPLFFANAGIFCAEVRRLAHRSEVTWVVLQCEAITDLDVTAAGALSRLDEELNDSGVKVAFVEMRSRLVELLERYGLFPTLTPRHFFATLDEAIAYVESSSMPNSQPDQAPPQEGDQPSQG